MLGVLRGGGGCGEMGKGVFVFCAGSHTAAGMGVSFGIVIAVRSPLS